MMRSVWQFTERRVGNALVWNWCGLRGDGTVARQRQSTVLRSYGAAVCDAMRSGFDPKRDEWVCISGNCIAHFEADIAPHLVAPATSRGNSIPRCGLPQPAITGKRGRLRAAGTGALPALLDSE